MELPGIRKRGRPKRRFMDVVKEGMAEVEVTEEDTEDRNNWLWKICCGNGEPLMGKPKEEEEDSVQLRRHCGIYDHCKLPALWVIHI